MLMQISSTPVASRLSSEVANGSQTNELPAVELHRTDDHESGQPNRDAAPSTRSSHAAIEPIEVEDNARAPDDLDVTALTLLAVQQASNSFSARSAEFAFPLFFVNLYPGTLLPASIYGFVTTACAIVLSGTVGTLIDRWVTHRLALVRSFILAQKILVCAVYGLFLLLFLHARLRQSQLHGGGLAVFSLITLLGCPLTLANVGVAVAVERDWVTSIAAGSSRRLTRLNSILRRIDLLSKLLSPLLVSLFTATIGYTLACVTLLAITAATTLFELSFIGIVFHRFKVLGEEQAVSRQARIQAGAPSPAMATKNGIFQPLRAGHKQLLAWTTTQADDWTTFARMPIFISSVSIALLYMSVLSFDSTFIAYLKSETTYSDAFIGGMRGVCVLTGLLGTFVSSWLSNRIGLVRTGSWSIVSEFLPLTPVVLSFYVGSMGRDRPAWNTAMLFTGLALSRIGLWSFDLAQLALVQSALATHPRRNGLMALQFSLQNLLDLAHYGLTLGWNRPRQFRNAADVSYAAIGLAAALYVGVYARKERGHVLHLDRLGLDRLLSRKQQ